MCLYYGKPEVLIRKRSSFKGIGQRGSNGQNRRFLTRSCHLTCLTCASPFPGTVDMNSNFSCFSTYSRSASAFWNWEETVHNKRQAPLLCHSARRAWLTAMERRRTAVCSTEYIQGPTRFVRRFSSTITFHSRHFHIAVCYWNVHILWEIKWPAIFCIMHINSFLKPGQTSC